METKHKSYLDYLQEFVDLLGISTAVQIGIKPNGRFLNNLGNGFIVAFAIITLKAAIELVIKIISHFKPKNNNKIESWPIELVQEINNLKLNPEFFKSRIWEETVPYINEILGNPVLCNSLGVKPYILIASMVRVSYEMWEKKLENDSLKVNESNSYYILKEEQELFTKYKSEFAAIFDVLSSYIGDEFDRVVCIFVKLPTGQVQLNAYIVRKNMRRVIIPIRNNDRYLIGDAFMSIYEKHKFRIARLTLYNNGKAKIRFDNK